MKSTSKKRKQTVKVAGYWRVSTLGNAYWVKPYKYERKLKPKPKPKPKRKPEPKKPTKRKPPKGFELEKHFDISEPEERIVYTFKIEALVEYQGRYVTTFSLDKDLAGEKAIEYYHTKFRPTIAEAKDDVREEGQILRASSYLVDFMSVDLYRVSGEGTLAEKRWKLLKSYSTPEDVK